MGPTERREVLRETFDSAVPLYHRSRPDYPAQLFDDLVVLPDLQPDAHALEVGCGTGKATLGMAERGYRITALELGPSLAAVARANLNKFPMAQVEVAAFESWACTDLFDLVYAATAWQWIDPATRYEKAWACLRPGGHVAFWDAGHVFPEGGDSFFTEIQEVYDEIGEGDPPGTPWPRPGEQPDYRQEILASGLFDGVQARHYSWEFDYCADEYIDLLNTFSGHITMEPWRRDRLYAEIRRRLAQRSHGRLRRGWGAVLHVARRRP